MSAETVSGTGLEVPSFALLIILLPMLAFPVILLLGRLFNGKDWWRGCR